MLKLGILGTGHLGKIHLKLAKSHTDIELVGFYDPNKEVQKQVSEEFGVKAFETPEELIEAVDALDIVTPTTNHFEMAKMAIQNRRHVFIEKPVTQTAEEAKRLINLAHEADVKVQVGHVERFNPAFTAVNEKINNPMFIETHRLAQFNPRGTDVPVVLDLMIHDLDIVLSIVKSNIKKISASGVALVSDTPDIANARLEFDNGCVANLTTSRMSMKNMRKTRLFQKGNYISIDFLEKKSELISIEDVEEESPFDIVMDLGEKGKKKVEFEKADVQNNNAIYDELTAFAKSIKEDTTPVVSIEDGTKALDVALQIMKKIEISSGINL